MTGSDRETGLIASVTDRRVPGRLWWLPLVTLVVLSGCLTGAGVTASSTTPGDTPADAATTATASTTGDQEADSTSAAAASTAGAASTSSPTASAEPTSSPSSTEGSTGDSPTSTAPTASPTTAEDSTDDSSSSAASTASPTAAGESTATETPTATSTGDGESLSQAEARQAFVSSLESDGIAVERLELADSIWMLTYSSQHTSWDGFADEMETITLAYCGLFERGLPMGFEGSDSLEMTVLDESGTAPAIGGWRVDPFTMCQPYLDGELSERELMAEVFGTLRIDESD